MSREAPGAHIEIRRARVSFTRADGSNVSALSGIDLDIERGEFVCIIGRSGEGKTTLLNAVAGLVPLSAGEVLTNGRPVTRPGADRGVVFQDDSVFPWMRVLANVEFGLRIRGVPRQRRRDIAMEHLRLVDLEGVAHSWPKELSGGMRARVAVAAVFANDPEVLLADEPFGSLDYVTRRRLQDVILELWERTHKTVLFVTHDVEEALVLASRVVVVSHGQVVEDCAIHLDRPRTEAVLASAEAVAIRTLVLEHLGIIQHPTRTGDGLLSSAGHDRSVGRSPHE
ncbi:MAG TPA: ATP-binding cassette domain-containing protein [Actinomycetes bacterium]|jgi:NitT/TauT family transport system ATP-binding protein|nr:ATP-binding cassette domain-containing protein [Actinomycetes bacterium]